MESNQPVKYLKNKNIAPDRGNGSNLISHETAPKSIRFS